MIEKGRRKTAPPDTARVKVHKYNLKVESNTHIYTDTLLLGLLRIDTHPKHYKLIPGMFSPKIGLYFTINYSVAGGLILDYILKHSDLFFYVT